MTGRIAVASLIQETNTFAAQPSTLDDFVAQGLWLGEQAEIASHGTNSEFAGALARVAEAGLTPVPIMRVWAMSGGILDAPGFAHLRDVLVDRLARAESLDALVLCLHGALVADGEPAADAALTEAARAVLGPDVPLVVTHDLHANVTGRVVAAADAVIGYHTYPHVDQGETGQRGADLAVRAVLHGLRPRTVLAKRPMLVPAEAQAIADPPMSAVRALADALCTGPILDVSLFPVQPWLDVAELGFGVTVTYAGGEETEALTVAERVAERAWEARSAFVIDTVGVGEAIRRVRARAKAGPVLLVQSADSPTAGASADSAAVIAALAEHGRGLRAYATLVDAPAVEDCFRAGVGAAVATTIGATLDPRWSSPTPLRGTVVRLGSDPVVLAGASMTGQSISMGRWATVDAGDGLVVLVTQRPAPTFDPAGYRHAGLEPADADAVVVRSATMYRAGFHGLYSEAILLDLPGASTPRLDYLDFQHAPRPLYPIDVGAQP